MASIYGHAAVYQPLYRFEPDVEADEQEVRAGQDFPAQMFRPLPENVEITRDEVRAAMQDLVVEQLEDARQVETSLTKAAHLLQQALLRAALDAQMRQLWQTPSQARSLPAQARCKLLAALLRWQEHTRQRVVMAHAIWKQALGKVVWELTIGIPIGKAV